jgi:hypothetical protein
MFDSQTILAASTAATVLYSPWFPRGGDHAIFGLEVQGWSESNAGTKLKIEVFHKKREDSGDGAIAGVSGTDHITIESDDSTPWRSTRDWGSVGFYDLVRFKITFTANSATQWAIFRILAPIWYDSVKA